jgi:hypothetical protein
MREYNARRSAGRYIPISGLATAEDDEGDTAYLNIDLGLQVQEVGRRGIQSSREKTEVDIEMNQSCENEHEV